MLRTELPQKQGCRKRVGYSDIPLQPKNNSHQKTSSPATWRFWETTHQESDEGKDLLVSSSPLPKKVEQGTAPAPLRQFYSQVARIGPLPRASAAGREGVGASPAVSVAAGTQPHRTSGWALLLPVWRTLNVPCETQLGIFWALLKLLKLLE